MADILTVMSLIFLDQQPGPLLGPDYTQHLSGWCGNFHSIIQMEHCRVLLDDILHHGVGFELLLLTIGMKVILNFAWIWDFASIFSDTQAILRID